MGDYLPSVNDLIINLIGAAITGLAFWGWSRFKNAPKVQINKWILASLITYFVVTVSYILLKTYGPSRKPEIFTYHKFAYEDVYLDNKRFFDCTFTNCRLIYEGKSTYQMTRCGYYTCMWLFKDDAGRTLQTIHAMKKIKGMEDVFEHEPQNVIIGK